jgi:predicted nucleic acid-binding protein
MNQSPLMVRSKLRLVCFLILKSGAPGTLRSAFQNDSMALFISAEIFSCAAFQENS